MKEEDLNLDAQLKEKENKIKELQGRLACASGQKPDSEDTHYLSGYGQQVAIEQIHDSITSFNF